MTECYSAKAIQDMFFYAEVHTFMEMIIAGMLLVVFVYIFDSYRKKTSIKENGGKNSDQEAESLLKSDTGEDT